MHLNTRLSRARLATPACVVGLLIAFVAYANGAAFIAHQSTAHNHDNSTATAHVACTGSHGHSHSPAPPASDVPDGTPTPGSDAPCSLCDMLLATSSQAALIHVASPAPTSDTFVYVFAHRSLTCDHQPQPSISRRGPPLCV